MLFAKEKLNSHWLWQILLGNVASFGESIVSKQLNHVWSVCLFCRNCLLFGLVVYICFPPFLLIYILTVPCWPLSLLNESGTFLCATYGTTSQDVL